MPYNRRMTIHDRDAARIEKAITFLANNMASQPRLALVARHVGISEFHFQRVFTRWAGVSPKKFLQYLTADHARNLLRDSRSVLDAAYEVGLSGGARLHDLTISLYGMTPGEVKAQGAGQTIRYGLHPSPFGPCFFAMTGRGICSLRFIRPETLDTHIAEIRNDWPGATIIRDQKETAGMVRRVFRRGGREASDNDLALHVPGTPFQIKVWEALLQIPAGHVTSYQDLARRIGRPAAQRAVGSAVGQNRVSYLIPCHRVIRSTGKLGGYRWGLTKKNALLGWEAAQRDRR